MPGLSGFCVQFLVIFVLDKELHDLVASSPDHGETSAAQQSLNGVDRGLTDPAHDLHGLVDHIPAVLGDHLFGL